MDPIIIDVDPVPPAEEETVTEEEPQEEAAPEEAPPQEEASPEEVPPAVVVGISLVAEPYKTTYFIGEKLDLDGLVVYRELIDGEEEEIPLEELTVVGFNSEEATEEQVVIIEYNGFTADFTVSIEKEEGQGIFSRIFGSPLLNLLFVLLLILIAIILGVKKSRRKEKKQHKKKPPTAKDRKKRRIIIAVLILAGLALFAYAGAMYLLAQMEREKIAQDDESLGIDEDSGHPGITNIAVFGIDSEDGMKGRSDAIMILTLDEVHKKIKITSLPRDTYVDIPGRRLDKINHAYAFGGPELAIKTINQNFNLDIRRFVSVNFTSMPAIIDAVGGVEVEVTDREAREISGIGGGGAHVLNGKQALRFSRLRKIDSDFERGRRQRDIMESTIEAALKAPVTSYPGVVSKVFPHLTTNLTSNQILNLGRKTVMSNISTIEQVQFPPRSMGKGQMINGVYYFVFDRAVGAKMLSDYIYNDKPLDG